LHLARRGGAVIRQEHTPPSSGFRRFLFLMTETRRSTRIMRGTVIKPGRLV